MKLWILGSTTGAIITGFVLSNWTAAMVGFFATACLPLILKEFAE